MSDYCDRCETEGPDKHPHEPGAMLHFGIVGEDHVPAVRPLLPGFETQGHSYLCWSDPVETSGFPDDRTLHIYYHETRDLLGVELEAVAADLHARLAGLLRENERLELEVVATHPNDWAADQRVIKIA